MGKQKEYLARIELIVLTAWLAKDGAWVLLLAPLAWPAALAAVGLEVHSVLLDWGTSSCGLRVHTIAALAWLVGNATWMTAELLFDKKSGMDKAGMPLFPWHSGPLGGVNDMAYDTGVLCAQVLFIAALVSLLCYYVVCLKGLLFGEPSSSQESGGNPQDEDAAAETPIRGDELIFGVVTPTVYAHVFIGPWIVKDLFWSFELLYPAVVFSIIAFTLAADAYRRFHMPTNLVEMFWIVANTAWIYGELGVGGLWPRLLCAALLFVGMALALTAYCQLSLQSEADDRREALASEVTPLIH